MIYDRLDQIKQYQGMHPHLDTAIDYILTHDLNALPMGRTEVDGSNVFINVMSANASPLSEQNFEFHKEYMDIQIDLSGCEAIQIGDPSLAKPLNYKTETDYGEIACPVKTDCTLGSGFFIVCMVEEPHRPGLLVTEAESQLKKCVFKVHR